MLSVRLSAHPNLPSKEALERATDLQLKVGLENGRHVHQSVLCGALSKFVRQPVVGSHFLLWSVGP